MMVDDDDDDEEEEEDDDGDDDDDDDDDEEEEEEEEEEEDDDDDDDNDNKDMKKTCIAARILNLLPSSHTTSHSRESSLTNLPILSAHHQHPTPSSHKDPFFFFPDGFTSVLSPDRPTSKSTATILLPSLNATCEGASPTTQSELKCW